MKKDYFWAILNLGISVVFILIFYLFLGESSYGPLANWGLGCFYFWRGSKEGRSGDMRYRIVTDTYSGFEVQAWRWWFPIWLQIDVNTSLSARQAKEWLNLYLAHKTRLRTFKQQVIEEWEAK